jgi:hypothetical protein
MQLFDYWKEKRDDIMKPVMLSNAKRILTRLALSVCLLLPSGYCVAQNALESSVANDLIRLHLNGKVKSMTEITSVMDAKRDGKFRKVQKYKHTRDFNKTGYVTNEYDFDLLNATWSRTLYVYNKAGRLSRKRSFTKNNVLIEETVFEYDNQGRKAVEAKKTNVIMRLSMRNRKVVYHYKDLGDSIETVREERGQVRSRSVSNKGVLSKTVEYKYNADDSLFVKYVFRYNADGKLKESIYYAADEVLDMKDSCFYNESGLLKEKRFYSNPRMKLIRPSKIIYEYDDRNNVIEIAEYDAGNNLIKRLSSKYQYDSADNWIKQTEYAQDVVVSEIERTVKYY